MTMSAVHIANSQEIQKKKKKWSDFLRLRGLVTVAKDSHPSLKNLNFAINKSDSAHYDVSQESFALLINTRTAVTDSEKKGKVCL